MEWTTDYTKTFANNEDRKLSFAFQVGGDLNDGILKLMKVVALTFNQNDEKTMEETFQVDYTHPIGKNKLEIGAKIINRDREMVYSDSSNMVILMLIFLITTNLFHHLISQLKLIFHLD